MEFWNQVKTEADQYKKELDRGAILPEHIIQRATIIYQNRLKEEAKNALLNAEV